jgi:hypothetical protein
MSSVVIAGDTSGTVTLAAPAVAGSTTLTLQANTGNIPVVTGTGTSGQVLTSGGSGAVSTWSTISSGGMTLLGTLAATSGNSLSLGSLTLTNYKALQVVMQSVVPQYGPLYITSDNSQTASYQSPFQMNAGVANSGIDTIFLGTGAFFGGSGQDSAANPNYGGGKTNITTTTTTVYLRLASVGVFSGGSFLVYGVA